MSGVRRGAPPPWERGQVNQKSVAKAREAAQSSAGDLYRRKDVEIESDDLKDAAVTRIKVAPAAIGGDELDDNVIDGDKLATDIDASAVTITGAIIQTADSGQRMVIDGTNDIIEFYTDIAGGESPGYIDPGVWSAGGRSSDPTVAIAAGVRSGGTVYRPILRLVGGNQTGGTKADTIASTDTFQVRDRTSTTAVFVIDTTASTIELDGIGSGAGMDTWQVAASATTTANSATNVTITGMSQTITCPGTTAVYLVDLDIEWVVGAGITGTIELLVDGTAQTLKMACLPSASTITACQHKRWRITGLSAGDHTFTARHRASGASSIVNSGNSVMTIERKA